MVSLRKRLKRALVLTAPGRFLYSALRIQGYLHETGWVNSLREGLPVDRDGNVLPWFTYPSIEFLRDRLQADMSVFEYGSGNSTLWFSGRVASVVSCEHDRGWYELMDGRLPGNVEYLYRELSDGQTYSRAILERGAQFNVVVIDGRDRVNCALNAVRALTSDGVIIWDDSERERYQRGCLQLTDLGFKRLDFDGLPPMALRRRSTSVFYREENCLRI
jgi:hypothetical protein